MPNSLLSQMLKHEYFRVKSFLEVEIRNNSYWGWRGFIVARKSNI